MMRVLKENKRLYIVDENGTKVYTPPDFLRPMVNRDLLQKLAESPVSIQDIVEFETRLRPK